MTEEETCVRPTRHIHEFLALGLAPDALDDESADKMKWVDLVALKTDPRYTSTPPLRLRPPMQPLYLVIEVILWASALLHELSRWRKFLSTICRIRTRVKIEIN